MRQREGGEAIPHQKPNFRAVLTSRYQEKRDNLRPLFSDPIVSPRNKNSLLA